MSETTFSKILYHLISAFIGVAVLFPAIVDAQGRSDEEAALFHIEALKEGHIIFILPAHLGKLNQLHRMRQAPENSEKARQRYDDMYRELIVERDSLHKNIRQAFEKQWTFCPYHFIYDFQLRTQPPDTNFAQVEPIAPADLPGAGYRIRIGKTRSTAHFGVEAMVVTDPDGTDLKRPFPFYVKLNKRTWLNGLVSIFFPSAYEKKDETDLIMDLHTSLERFYFEHAKASQP